MNKDLPFRFQTPNADILDPKDENYFEKLSKSIKQFEDIETKKESFVVISDYINEFEA